MTTGIPPNPTQFRNQLEWANQLYEYLLYQNERRGEQNPQPVLLSHRVAGVQERAAVDGILMYQPGAGVVVSENGRWKPMGEDAFMTLAENEILGRFGDKVSVLGTSRSFAKFGKTTNADSGVLTELQEFAANTIFEETLATANDINHIVSDNAGDTQEVVVAGHVIDFTTGQASFSRQVVTLNGTTPVLLPTPIARANDLVVNTSSASPQSPILGNVSVFQSAGASVVGGVVSPPDNVKCYMPQKNEADKGLSTVGGTAYLLLTGLALDLTGTGQNAKVAVRVEYKPTLSDVWLPAGSEASLRTGATTHVELQYRPYRIIPPSHDIRVVAISDTNNTSVTCTIRGMFAFLQ